MRGVVLASALAVAGCTAGPPAPPPSVARLPPGLFAGPDQDLAVMQYAQSVFSDAARTYGNPAEGAQAVIALDYIAGDVATSPRWTLAVDQATRADLLAARAAVRQSVGILPGASSQAVVDRLVVAHDALANGDGAAAAKALDGGPFARDGAGMVTALANLPYDRLANVATSQALHQMESPPGVPDSVLPGTLLLPQ